jgi:hypothetical protein
VAVESGVPEIGWFLLVVPVVFHGYGTAEKGGVSCSPLHHRKAFNSELEFGVVAFLSTSLALETAAGKHLLVTQMMRVTSRHAL